MKHAKNGVIRSKEINSDILTDEECQSECLAQ